jgi:hypothetical protein
MSPESQLSQAQSAQLKKLIQKMPQPSAAIGMNNRGDG